MNYQKTIVAGRLGRDPETKYLASGDAVCNFSVATSEKRGGEEHTTWFRVVAFKKTAEIAGQYLVKGSEVLIEGRIQTRQWDDKDGNKREAWEVVCDRLVLGAKPQGQQERPQQSQPQRQKPQPAAAGFGDFDDAPF